MTACRRPNDAYLIRVDVQLFGMRLEVADAGIDIAGRYEVVAMRHAVVLQYGSYALRLEEVAPGITFVVIGSHGITTARTNHHHRHWLIAFRDENFAFGSRFYGIGRQIIIIYAITGQGAIAPQIYLCATKVSQHLSDETLFHLLRYLRMSASSQNGQDDQ